MDSFYIFLRPAAFMPLFRIPGACISDRSYNGSDLLGTPILELYEQLAEARSFENRIQTAERFLSGRDAHPVVSRTENVIDRILAANGHVGIQDLAAQVSLSARQLNRIFQAEVGIPPKLFARIARFQSALAYKARQPQITWANTAQEFQYHDQMHLVREFRKLSGATPTELSDRLAFLNSSVRVSEKY